MIKLRTLAHSVMDATSDRFDRFLAAVQGDRRTRIPEIIRELEGEPARQPQSDSAPLALGDLVVVEGFDNGGSTVQDFSHTGVPLLDTFYFQFVSDDHHLALIEVNPDHPAGSITLAYQDNNGDDDYFYKTAHRVVNDGRVQRFSRSTDICSEVTCTVPLARPAGDFVFVLIGFSFSFTGGADHHIKRMTILESDGNLQVQFGDKHGSPPPIFLWDVQFAYVPRDLFVALDSSSGNGDSGGAGRDIAAGPSVIRGFSFTFENDDHHLRDIGVTTPDNGRVEVFFEDINGDDRFDWLVQWGILAT